MEINRTRAKVAVIGAGISGIACSYALADEFDVSLFEKNSRIGGHTNTRMIESGPDAGTAIDTGFIVCNARNYPLFYRFLASLNVPLRNSKMTFGYQCDSPKLCYQGPRIVDFLKTPRNLLQPKFLRLIVERERFHHRILKDLRAGNLRDEPLHDYLQRLRISEFFATHYLTPLIASIWSSSSTDVKTFPTLTFATFFHNHGMLEIGAIPQWQTVCGGSHAYLKAFTGAFKGTLVTDARIEHISRSENQATITFHDRPPQNFDYLVIATHADEALALLLDADQQESSMLGQWSYSKNTATLHTHGDVIGGQSRTWASWNYRSRSNRNDAPRITISYSMNILQGLRTHHDYIVSLNCDDLIPADKIIYQTEYTHPIYTPASRTSQDALRRHNGSRRTYFCGAYLGYGFHEDGVRSAHDVVSAIRGAR